MLFKIHSYDIIFNVRWFIVIVTLWSAGGRQEMKDIASRDHGKAFHVKTNALMLYNSK